MILFDKDGKQIGPIDLTSAVITQEINGEYSCVIVSLDEIQGEQIVSLEDANGTDQLFRLGKPERRIDDWVAQGWHITQDLAHDLIVNRAWLTQTGEQAWPELVKAGMEDSEFFGSCDISSVRPLRIIRRSVLEAMIGTQDNSFINRFGGEVERDNYRINCVQRIGQDRGFQIKLGRDIVGVNVEKDYYSITNRIIPT